MELVDIVKICEDLAEANGVVFDLPVSINNRLTRTLGQVKFTPDEVPYAMEFSGQLLRTATDESIEQIVKHEWAHWFAWVETGEVHGHDAIFKKICSKIGCSSDKSKTKVERIVEKDAVYRYVVVCPECGRKWYYNRRGKVIQNIDDYHCNNCGQGKLDVIKNW